MNPERRDLLISDYDCMIHLPLHRTVYVNEAFKLKDGETVSVGEIYRTHLDHSKRIDWSGIEIPVPLKMAVKNSKQRRILQKGFNLNSRRSPYEWWLKASSAFVSLNQFDGGAGFVLDVLQERPANEREIGSVLHQYLRDEFNCYEDAIKLGEKCNALSGHFSGILISNESVASIFLFDKYSYADAYENDMNDIERSMIRRLWENRIMPLTTDAYPIIPSEYRYKFSLDK